MKNRYIAKASVVCLLFFVLNGYAQKVETSTHKGAVKKYEQATKELAKGSYQTAVEYAKEALKTDPQFMEACILIAEGYSLLKDCKNACEYYKKALAIQKHHSKSGRMHLSAAYEFMNCGQPQEAIYYFEKYFVLSGTKGSGVAYNSYELCLWRAKMMQDSLIINPQNIGRNINSTWSEYFPSLTADESELIFTVLRPRDTRTQCLTCKEEEDFYVSKKVEGQWAKRRAMRYINTPYNEGAQSISPDGRYLIFTGCEREDGKGSCDLYWSKRIGDKWSKPKNFGSPVNTRYWESQPAFGSDGKTIYFSSNRPGGLGNMDLWQTTMIEEGTFSQPVNLGKTINTMQDESAPYIHPDGVTLYFVSTGHRGMGGQDIFYSKWQSNDSWGEPVNMGYPINTHRHEDGLFITAKGDKAFFSSDKKGGYGGMDIYWFELPEALRPLPVTYFKGKILDNKDRTPLEAVFEVIDLKTNKMVVASSSDPETGEFLVCIPTNSHYAVNAVKEHYLFYSENFEIDGQHSKITPYEKDIALKRIELGEGIVLKNVFFDTDKSVLKTESQVELDRLVLLMQQNPNMKIEIGGHTDNVGNKEHNAALSKNRAKSVYDYLVSKKIDAQRLTYQGYGFDKPIASNDTEDGRALNRRTEFTIIGF